jgi:subtilisin-like proprotein convertase family protein
MKTIGLVSVMVAFAGCAVNGMAKPDADDVAVKEEALLGAPCTTDAACDGWEYCDRLACIPERPCPDTGVCRDHTRFWDFEGAQIPDNDPAGVTRTLSVSRPDATVASLLIDLSIDHPYRGDLEVVLRSPAGFEVVLHNRTGGGEDDLTITREVPEMVGQVAAGDWQLVVRDLARADAGHIQHWNMTLAYTAVAPVDDGSNVWSSITMDGIESPHPYTNRLSRTWDVRPWTGGASRARIHFTSIDVERNYDFVEILNADTNAVLDRFTGQLTDLTTREYDTANLLVRLRTDASVTRWGFRADRIDVYGAGCTADADCGPGRQCDDSIVCIRYPCFNQCVDALGGEGASCDETAECDEGLYCNGSGVCAQGGSCEATADCSAEGNEWVHVLCVGYPTCGAEGQCGWVCGPPPVCTEGETMNDGCNDCVCVGGVWGCTKRFCPPTAAEGEACGNGTVCGENLVCDRGASTEPVMCGDDRAGVCLTTEPRFCRALYAPVCTCNGQTYPNECGRAGQGDWAHAGRCELSIAIPDANATGVRHTIHVQTPVDATMAHVDVEIDHTWRGDLVVYVEAPNGTRHFLTNRAGGSEDDFTYAGEIDLAGSSPLGAWTLVVSDRATQDVGVLRFFNVMAMR